MKPSPQSNKTTAQVAHAKKAAALKAALARSAPPADHFGVRLMSKKEVLAIVGVTYPTLWMWMRAGSFPRSRIVVGKSKWLSSEVEHWLATLPMRRLKGDQNIDEGETASR
jgi:predicted DNA-binding transcriptional regulator AlpA